MILSQFDNWAAFAEKGGIAGAIDWMPIEQIAATLEKLVAQRNDAIQLLYQITGMSDILRGQSDQYAGVGQEQIKAQYASIRVQALQDQFAKFASDLLKIKAEIISRHCEPHTIVKRSNILSTPDREMAAPAIKRFKQWDMAALTVKIRPESVAMVDYAQLKAERGEYVTALATFMQSAAPLAEMDKSIVPTLLELLKWGLAGYKGSQEIEGVLDKAIDEFTKKSQQQGEEQDPAQAAEQAKQQGKLAEIQAKTRARMAEIQASSQAKIMEIQADAQADQATGQQSMQAKMAEITAQHHANLAEIRADLNRSLMVSQADAQADIIREAAQQEFNLMEEYEKAVN